MKTHQSKTIETTPELTVTNVCFTDAEFMTAKEKELVLKNWERFLQGGLTQKLFTRRLYEHLHLHCSFIAHYDLSGFHREYFQSAPDTERFFDYFCQNTERHKTAIRYRIEAEVSRKLGLLETCLMQAKHDNRFAKELLRKIHF